MFSSIFLFVYLLHIPCPYPHTFLFTSEFLGPRTLPSIHQAHVYYIEKYHTVSAPSGRHYINYMLMAVSSAEVFPTAGQNPPNGCSAN